VAKKRYGWEKRAKELARKAKHEAKMKHRQNKSQTESIEKTAESQNEDA